jgi:hypothetical protein
MVNERDNQALISAIEVAGRESVFRETEAPRTLRVALQFLKVDLERLFNQETLNAFYEFAVYREHVSLEACSFSDMTFVYNKKSIHLLLDVPNLTLANVKLDLWNCKENLSRLQALSLKSSKVYLPE